jgi:hypothetical protein
MAPRNTAVFEPELASALTLLGIQLSEAGRPEDGLAVAEEAVILYRRLAQDNPDMYADLLRAAAGANAEILDQLGRTQ